MGIYAPNNPNRTTIVAWKWGAYLGDEALKNGIRVKSQMRVEVTFHSGNSVSDGRARAAR